MFVMVDCIISVTKLDFVLAYLGEDSSKFLIIHIDSVVQRAAVADDQDLFIRHRERSFPEKAFFLELERHLALLIVEIAAAGPRRDAARDEFRGCLRDDEDFPAVFDEVGLNPADSSGLAAAGAAGDHNLPYILFHMPDPFPDISCVQVDPDGSCVQADCRRYAISI